MTRGGRPIRPDLILGRTDPICSSGKIGYRTVADAETALRKARAARRDGYTGRIPDRIEESTYACPACGWHHLSSTTGPMRRGTYSNRGRGR